nr:hypothetical protein [Tanacetum cinerariifolium]
MLVAQEVGEGVADEVHDERVPAAGVATEGVVSAAHDEKVGTGQRIETSDDTVMDDVSNQERMIADMDTDVDVVLEEAKEVADDAKADQDAKEDESEPAKVQKVVDVVTTAKFITEVVTAASITITAAEGVVIRDPKESTTTTTSIIIHTEAKSKDKGKGILVEEPKPLKKQAQIEQDEKFARELEAELNRNIDWDKVIDHVKKKAKEDHAVKRKNMMIYLKNVDGFKMDYFKGMSYDNIRPIFEAKFDTNVAFLQKTKEQIKEEESRALKRINETLTEKATKRQKLDEEVEELKRHLQIVPNEDDDDVYTEATPLARKVPVVGYEIVNQNNKPYYKIIRANYHYIYNHTADFVSREEVPTHKVHFGSVLNAIRLEVEEESEVSLELSSFGVDAVKEFKEKYAKCLMLLAKDLMLSSQDNTVD